MYLPTTECDITNTQRLDKQLFLGDSFKIFVLFVTTVRQYYNMCMKSKKKSKFLSRCLSEHCTYLRHLKPLKEIGQCNYV